MTIKCICNRVEGLHERHCPLFDGRRPKTYDSKCYELAEHFLADVKDATEAEKDQLAREIQQAVEDFISEIPAERHP